MNPNVNRYELSENVTIKMLKESGFKEVKSDDKITLVYYRQLITDIDLFIEFDITNSSILKFDDSINISIIDDEFCQYYQPFYSSISNSYSDRVIKRYNNIMNSLVNKKIFKIKEKEQDKKLIKAK